ncbi:hypothetical protein OG871_34445 [Kitasatospora sp. NBC_00374]|uniref:hypothetical protein n=1 Tax=Kitasatospora sp. NBC_00374 TaxID=2975964 RepID=UPI003249DA68
MAVTTGRRTTLGTLTRGPARPSDTPTRLRRVAAVLALCTATTWGALSLTLSGAHGVVTEAGSRTVPSIVDSGQAAYYLADADRVAAASFASGSVRLTGPGQQYQDDLKSAHQALARVAEHDPTGAAGSAQLQAVAGLLVEYTGLVEQAHAAEGDGGLGGAYLGYASGLMHKPDDGILARIGQLQAAELDRLAQHRRSVWTAPGLLFAVLAPALVGLVVLVRTQRFLRRHFHRRVNPCLLAASVLLTALAGWSAVGTVGVDDASATAGDRVVPRLVAAWKVRTVTAAAAGSDTAAVVRGERAGKLAAGFYRYSGMLTDREITAKLVDEAKLRPPEFGGTLADLLRPELAVDGKPGTTGATRREAALRTLQDYRAFVAAHDTLQLGVAVDRPGLGPSAAGPARTELGGAIAALDTDLAEVTDLGRRQLADAVADSRSDRGLGLAVPLLCAAVALLCGLGLWPRIDEYRAVAR